MRLISRFRDVLLDIKDRVAHDLWVVAGFGSPRPFSTKLQARRDRWRRASYRPLARIFTSKVEGANLARSLGVSIPDVLWRLPEAKRLRDVELPTNFVLKPERGHSSCGVFIIRDGVDQFSGQRLDIDALVTKAAQASDGPFLVEELLTNFDRNPGIPYDYKFFCFGAKVAAIQVIDRNGGLGGKMTRSWSLGPDWRPLPFHLHSSGRSDCGPAPIPPFADEMVAVASSMGAQLGVFMRIDLFATTRGPVFGEFEPFGHRHFTAQANAWLGSLWKGLEGCRAEKPLRSVPPAAHRVLGATDFVVGRDHVSG